jgi:ubiquinone/menaquinone biosynthesis C-methylase UbiE
LPVKQEIYEYLAQQIIMDYSINEGRCLDIGTGQGNLGLELAKRSQLHLYLLDIKGEPLEIALEAARENGLLSRVSAIRAAVENLPFLDDYFDLVVSRGSIFFWRSQTEGLREVNRVLRPGGAAYIGGGTSRLQPREAQEEFYKWARPRHREACIDWDKVTSEAYLRGCLEKADVRDFHITKDTGTWIEIRK